VEKNEVPVERGTVIRISADGIIQVQGESGISHLVHREDASGDVRVGDSGRVFRTDMPRYTRRRFLKDP
jgi:hypothetical protein